MAVLRAASGEKHVQTQLEVLEQRTMPVSAMFEGDGLEHREPGELPVSAHPDRTHLPAQGLHGRDHAGELHVLKPNEQPGKPPAVVVLTSHLVSGCDPYLDLDGADIGVPEERGPGDHCQALRIEATIGVDDADDQVVCVGAGREAGAQGLPTRVQSRSLATAGVGKMASDHVQSSVPSGHPGQDLRSGVARSVVDTPQLGGREGPDQLPHRCRYHLLLVETGDDEMPGESVMIPREGGLSPQERHQDEQHVGDEAHAEKEGCGVQRSLQQRPGITHQPGHPESTIRSGLG